MRRRHWAIFWAAAAVPMVWYHVTRSPTLLNRDAAGAALRAGSVLEARGDAAAADRYRAAAAALAAANAGPDEMLAVSVAQLRAESHDRSVPEQISGWQKLLESSAAKPAASPALLNDMRLTLAGLHYESALVLAKVAAPRAVWVDEADQARQQFAYVAATDVDSARADAAAVNVEKAYALQHTDKQMLMSRLLKPEQQPQQQQILQAKQSKQGEPEDSQTVLGKSPSAGGRPTQEPQKSPPLPPRGKGS